MVDLEKIIRDSEARDLGQKSYDINLSGIPGDYVASSGRKLIRGQSKLDAVCDLLDIIDDPDPPGPKLTPREELEERIREHIRRPEGCKIVGGIHGDHDRAGAYEEEIIHPPEGGTYTKFYGVSQLFEGEIDSALIDVVAQVKRVFVASAELALKYRYLLPFVFISRTKTLDAVVEWATRICEADLYQKRPTKPHLINRGRLDFKKLTRLQQHLIQVGDRIITEVFRRGTGEPPSLPDRLRRLLRCIVFFFEDRAYAWRFRDVFALASKVGVADPVGELRRLFGIYLSREKAIGDKARRMERLLFFLLKRSPKLKLVFSKFFEYIDTSIVRMSKSESYFTLDRSGYDYGGRSIEERRAEKKRIDEERGNIVLDI